MVERLHFARQEFVRCVHGVSLNESYIHMGQMNCISWTIGHLAEHEHRVFVFLAQGKNVLPELRHITGYGSRQSTPKLDDMWHAWREATANADVYLETLTTETLQEHFEWKGKPLGESIGTMLHRVIYHYWYHLGETHAIRQMLGHRDMPQFIGDMTDFPYTPE
jgi:uncharacterized damage-inducible protein DinB